MGASQALLRTFLHNKSSNDCKHFMVSKWRSHKFCEKLFHRYFTLWFTHSFRLLPAYLIFERSRFMITQTLLLEKNEKHSREKLFIYLYKNGLIHKNILGKLMSWTVYNCFEHNFCFLSVSWRAVQLFFLNNIIKILNQSRVVIV